MTSRFLRRNRSSSQPIRQQEQEQLPFTNDAVQPQDFGLDQNGADRGLDRPTPHSRLNRTHSNSAFYSSSYAPSRSYFQASHGPESAQYASSLGVRQLTAELASWQLSEQASLPGSYTRSDTSLLNRPRTGSIPSLADTDEPRDSIESTRPEVIAEVSEPVSPEPGSSGSPPSPSELTNRIRSEAREKVRQQDSQLRDDAQSRRDIPEVVVEDADMDMPTERTSLLPRARLSDSQTKQQYHGSNELGDVEGQSSLTRTLRGKGWRNLLYRVRQRSNFVIHTATHPGSWDRKALVRNVFWEPIKTIPAVIMGLLLNILDALSYGLILFPLGTEIFADKGPDGISIFFVSTIVSQLVFSSGGTIFRGGVGSEMIEVVPFFHKMAFMIMNHMGTDDPDAVVATTIMSYCLSSIVTGAVFFVLGAANLGTLVSFFPRNILTGCIGGVGLFLIITGLEVSARLEGNLEYNLDTLRKLVSPDTILLWTIPLLLAIILLTVRHFVNHPMVTPAYFIGVTAIFYIVTAAVPNLNLELLRSKGWVFEAPPAGIAFYRFYSFFKFKKMNWEAILRTVPTMFALTFFGILHVPINVPALGIAAKEDDVDINKELKGHGISNALSGCLGSIQNYLVYANSVLFMNNGGNTRLAGYLLAAATTGVWIAGPGLVGYIPVMIVGTLIYMLGIELAREALYDSIGKLHRLEYLTIVAIVVIMGIYDFVVGIVLGIVLACLNYVVQTSRKSAISGMYNGTIAESTVRRHPIQRRFLREVGSQTQVIKLTGYLFFGSIVTVENKVRAMIDEEAFKKLPMRYLILDFSHVTGLDFSAAEAFTRMNRIIRRRDVQMILSGVNLQGEIGKSLGMVGLLSESDEDSDEDYPPPQVFEDLNQALEACENELLIAFKQRSDMLAQRKGTQSTSIAVPQPEADHSFSDSHASPRRTHLQRAATSTLTDQNIVAPSKWSNFRQPLGLILQAFQNISDKNEDFWWPATDYFERKEYPQGAVLYSRGDEPDGFYLLEKGILRAEYDLKQGSYYETIVAGTTCGELPFFSETERSATVAAESDCVAWLLTPERWKELQERQPEVARELLRVGLKLTSERMNAVTSYVLVTAG